MIRPVYTEDIESANKLRWNSILKSNFKIGFYEIVKLLVENGADANAKISDDGTAPLHLAVKFGNGSKVLFFTLVILNELKLKSEINSAEKTHC